MTDREIYTEGLKGLAYLIGMPLLLVALCVLSLLFVGGIPGALLGPLVFLVLLYRTR